MKIAYYATTILEHGGGLEKLFIESSRNMSKCEDVDADVVTMDNHFTEKIIKMLEFFYFKKINRRQIYKENLGDIRHRLGSARYYKIDTIDNLRKKLNSYDVIYSKNEILEAFILKFLIGYNKLPPIIFGCHTPMCYPSTISIQSKLHNFLYNGFIYKFLTDGIRVFHVTNTFDENNLHKLIPNKKIIKIYNPLQIKDFKKLSKQYVYNFNWDKSKFNILWAARLTEQKGLPELLWIIDSLNKTPYKNKIIFNIAGDGESSFKQEIGDLQIKWKNVNVFGYVQSKHMPSIYCNNDLFISTSRWEAFGLSLLEVQALGLPAISFDIPGPQDIVINNKTGFLVQNKYDYVEKIKKIVDKKIIFNKKGIIDTVGERFDAKIIYNELKKMFEQALYREN